jgi:hypothetical protein
LAHFRLEGVVVSPQLSVHSCQSTVVSTQFETMKLETKYI